MDWSLYLAIILWTTLYRSGAYGLMLFWVLYTACELITWDFKVECKSLVSIVLVWDTNKIFTFLLLFFLPFIPGSGAEVSEPSSCFANSYACSIPGVRWGISVFHGHWKQGWGPTAFMFCYSAPGTCFSYPHTRMDAFLEICLISLSRMWMN